MHSTKAANLLLFLLILASSCVTSSPQAEASIVDVGDLIVSDFTSGVLFKVNPTTGVQTVLASGGGLVNPNGIAIEDSGTIIVAERSSQSLIRINLQTGLQTTISSGGSFVNIVDVELEASGQILVSDPGANAIFRVDPISGAQSTVSSAGFVNNLLRGIAVESSGDILALNNSVIRIDPNTGNQSLLSSGPNYQASANVAVEADGNILVVDREAFSTLGGVFRVDPSTGAQSVVSAGVNFDNPFGLALESSGQILISDYTNQSIYRVDPISGSQTLLSSSGFLALPLEMEVSHVTVSAIPEPSSLAIFSLLTIGFIQSRGRRRLS